MKKNQYYCIVKDNKVVYISTSENSLNKVLEKLDNSKKLV